LRNPAGGGQKGLADEGLVRDADHGRRAIVQRDEDRPVVLAQDEALGAVDRIDHPGQRGRPWLAAVLFAMDPMIGVRTLDGVANHRLGSTICDGHRVVTHEVAVVPTAITKKRNAEPAAPAFTAVGRRNRGSGWFAGFIADS
jgi:hypothetical protein